MEDNYDQEFDHLFARDLKTAGQNAAPDPEEWPALSSRLDATGKRRPWPLLLPWLLLSALALSNGWMLVQWRTLNQTVVNLQQQQGAIPPPAAAQPEHSATIVYDTIYRTVVVTRRILEERTATDQVVPKNNRSQLIGESLITTEETVPMVSNNRILENRVAKTASNKQNLPENQSVDSNFVSKKQPADITASQPDNTLSDTTAQAQRAVTSSHFQPDSTTSQSSDTTARQRVDKSRLDSLLAQPSATAPPVKPHHEPFHWRIGIGTGIATPVGGEEVSFSKPVSFSFTGELMLGKHWAVVPGLMYTSHRFKTEEEFDPRLLMDAPVPPSQDFRFRYIEGSMSHWLGALALHYRFRTDQAWSWYVGAGYAARFTSAGKAEYEFKKFSTNEEYQYQIKPNIPARTLLGEVRGGLELALRPRWTLFGAMSGVLDWGPGQRTFPMMTGQIGLKWQVK